MVSEKGELIFLFLGQVKPFGNRGNLATEGMCVIVFLFSSKFPFPIYAKRRFLGKRFGVKGREVSRFQRYFRAKNARGLEASPFGLIGSTGQNPIKKFSGGRWP